MNSSLIRNSCVKGIVSPDIFHFLFNAKSSSKLYRVSQKKMFLLEQEELFLKVQVHPVLLRRKPVSDMCVSFDVGNVLLKCLT